MPRAAELSQNYPNPSNPSTTIEFRIGPHGDTGAVAAKLDIYDIRGRKVRMLLDAPLLPGNYRIAWNGRDEQGAPVPSGIYLYRLSCAGARIVRRMAVLR
jgi:flagellar hook assembly protein FlgD